MALDNLVMCGTVPLVERRNGFCDHSESKTIPSFMLQKTLSFGGLELNFYPHPMKSFFSMEMHIRSGPLQEIGHSQ